MIPSKDLSVYLCQVVSTLKVNINREKEARLKKILGLKKDCLLSGLATGATGYPCWLMISSGFYYSLCPGYDQNL